MYSWLKSFRLQFAFLGIVLLATATTAYGQCELEKLTASDGAADALFGTAVAIDGDVAIAGASATATCSATTAPPSAKKPSSWPVTSPPPSCR